ncbi:MAG: gliding motility-associated C-terminal domain-containing protein, partial [Bacteroidota bacterium]
AICQGNSIQLSVGSGDTFSWSPTTGLSDPSISNPVATPQVSTTYVATITDVCGQQRQDTVNVEVQLPGVDVLPDQIEMCPDGVTLRATTSFASYLWDDGSTDSLRFVTQPGTYTVTITNLCETWTESITVIAPDEIQQGVIDPISCLGTADGAFTMTLQNGNGPFLHQLLDAAGNLLLTNATTSNTRTFSNLGPGTYVARVSDAKGCTWQDAFDLSDPPLLQGTVANVTDIVCGGSSTGTVTLTATGGTPPYQYGVQGGGLQNNPTLTGLPAGTQNLLIQDANGCLLTLSASINENPPLSLSITDSVSIGCFGASTGWVTLQGSGGVGGYAYSLDGINFQASPQFLNLPAGSFTAFVRDDSACVGSFSFSLSQSPPLALLTNSVKGVDCAGNLTGAVTLQASGGVPAYVFARDGGPFGSDSTFANLPGGSLGFTVRDDSNCVTNLVVPIPEPAALQAVIDSVTEVDCFGNSSGIAHLSALGGSAPYRFGLLGQSLDSLNFVDSLAAGTYQLVVQDDSLCLDTTVVTVAEPPTLIASVTDRQDVDCLGSFTGSLSVGGQGGSLPYSFAIDQGPFGLSPTFGSLSAGFYTLRIQDANGCLAEVDTLITTPTGLAAGIETQIDVSCFGDSSGSLLMMAMGGTPPYSYTEDGVNFTFDNFFPNLPASIDTITLVDDNGCIVPIPYEIQQPDTLIANLLVQGDVACFGDSSGFVRLEVNGGVRPYAYAIQGGNNYPDSLIAGLPAGSYVIEVVDDSACNALLPIAITEPDELSLVLDFQRNVDCFGNATGAVDLLASGGVAPYLYAQDSSGLGTDNRFGSLTVGTYLFTVQDDSSCVTPLTVEITQPDSLILDTLLTQNIACAGDSTGFIELMATGGTRPYLFSNNGGTAQLDSGFYQLPAGLYDLETVDDSGCVATISVSLSEPPPLTLDLMELVDVDCHGNDNGLIQVIPAGGVPSYELSLNGESRGGDTRYGLLPPGFYEVLLTDANGCEQVLDSLEVWEPDTLVSSMFSQDVICFGEASGNAEVQVSGGILPYRYAWSNGTVTADNDSLIVGTYLVQVLDSNGCPLSDTAVIEEPPLLELSLVETSGAHCDFANGGAIVAAQGGIGAYTYRWSGLNLTDSIAENIPGVDYLVQVFDENGCVDSLSFSVPNVPPAEPFFVTDPSADTTILSSQNPVQFINQTIGGVSYLWDFGDGGRSLEENPNHRYDQLGRYLVTLTADNEFFACPTTYSLWLEIIPDGNLWVPNAFSPNGDGKNDRFLIGYEGVVSSEWTIYDRWGRQLRTYQSLAEGWDGLNRQGNPVPEGVYVFKLRALLNRGEWVERGGTITLVR